MKSKGELMEFDGEVNEALGKAFDENNVEEFRRLIARHPECLRDLDEGTDAWMWMAAREGWLPMLQMLVEQGMDVNESKDIPDPENEFCLFEGPIVHAASEGHTEVVRWLLEQGAKINYTVNGKVRCLPLLRAAAKGHFEVVKLLVEHGADLRFEFNGRTPISLAEDYGRSKVAEYLRSVGAK